MAVVSLNRPERLNALDVASKERLGAMWSELAADTDVRAVVLCGAGPRAFCAGSDITEVRETSRMVSTEILLAAIPGMATPLWKPVVAALHGHCVGMGLTLAIHCDFRICAPQARLSYPEVNHGMISAVSAMHLADLIGRDAAMRMLLLGESLDAETARAVGLVSELAEDPLSRALELASALAAKPAAAVQAHKRLAGFAVRRLSAAEREEVIEVRAWLESFGDYKDGAARFAARKG
ncbi:enoyl-CoA hydratase/isomerase family protein [Amorphus sp. 3PC139-8]|uniref:enoyl-CoA hydratase/isomerase family protein n=1 Tax=Amorphus sp. 3PC139-8 TaxID=2735676 RepID=UPI00345CB962